MSAPTTSVVQNDISKAAKATPLTTTPSTAPKLSEMEAKRQQWETTAYRTSNQQLYAVLSLNCAKALRNGSKASAMGNHCLPY